MRLEFLSEGSPECPLFRLYDFSVNELRQLQAAIVCQIKETGSLAIHRLPFVHTIDDCRLTFRIATSDLEISLRLSENGYICDLTSEAWDEIVELIEPLALGEDGYEWLVGNAGDIKLLLSWSGCW